MDSELRFWLITGGLTLGAVLILVALWATHARLAALDERCKAALGDIDTALMQRHQLIPGLVETVRGFAAHEARVLTDVTRARADAIAATGAARMEAETQIGQTVASLFSLVENYPEIAASSHFHDLRIEFARVEDRIVAARRFYNLAVEELNGTQRVFPGNLVGALARVGVREPFTLGDRRADYDRPVTIAF